MRKEHTYIVDGLINGVGGLYPGGLISRIIYSLVNGWAYIWGEGLKPGDFKVGFYGICFSFAGKFISFLFVAK